LPENTPHRETVLEPGDLITHVTLPPPITGSRQVYLKLRDRASYEFALTSAAVVITVAGGTVTPLCGAPEVRRKEVNELGARGIGEIGKAGIAAAITDAVHHATGVRVRELPVKIENLLA
jgi:CO/xanthine dehydrogenase FAD-binding subunit